MMVWLIKFYLTLLGRPYWRLHCPGHWRKNLPGKATTAVRNKRCFVFRRAGRPRGSARRMPLPSGFGAPAVGRGADSPADTSANPRTAQLRCSPRSPWPRPPPSPPSFDWERRVAPRTVPGASAPRPTVGRGQEKFPRRTRGAAPPPAPPRAGLPLAEPPTEAR